MGEKRTYCTTSPISMMTSQLELLLGLSLVFISCSEGGIVYPTSGDGGYYTPAFENKEYLCTEFDSCEEMSLVPVFDNKFPRRIGGREIEYQQPRKRSESALGELPFLFLRSTYTPANRKQISTLNA